MAGPVEECTAQEFHFGDFTLDQSQYRLQRGARLLRLEKLPMELLILLVQRRGGLVSREEIAECLWGKGVFLDVDHGINTAIRKVRTVLRDDPEKPRFVETVVGRGYRFAAPVICSNGDSLVASGPVEGNPALSPKLEAIIGKDKDDEKRSQTVSEMRVELERGEGAENRHPPGKSSVDVRRPSGPGGTSAAFPGSRTRLPLALAISAATLLCVLALVFALNVGQLRTRLWAGRAPVLIQSVAVLPLENLSHEADQEYFADGMTEELITSLGKIRALRVTSRTSVMQYKGVHKPLSQIGRELNVDAIVEGGVLRSGEHVRITAQLIHAPTDRHLWAESYDRELKDVLALQDDVARAIANEIRITLTPQDETRLPSTHPVNPEAFEAYLKGRYYWNKRTAQGIKKASDYFKQAIEKDPGYSLAYSGLADCNSGLAWHGFISPGEALPKAKAAALKAIEIDPQSAEAHASLALVLHHQGDWAKAETEFTRALELNPRYANAHHWYGDYLSVVGRHEEALAEAKRAFELDPLSPIINTWLGLRYYLAGRYDEAIEQERKTVEFDASFAPAHLLLGQAYVLKGMYEQAISELQNATSLSGGSPLYMAQLGVAYAAAGRNAEAIIVIDHLQKEAARSYVSPYGLAQIYAALGNKHQALKWLDIAYDEHAVWISYLNVDPILGPLRSEPGFHDLVRRMARSGSVEDTSSSSASKSR